MRSEPAIDRDGLRRVLRAEYGIDAGPGDLRFVPAGFSTACYAVGPHFVKVWPAAANEGRSAALLDLTLPLLERLGGQVLPARVPAPVRTSSGRLRAAHLGMPVAVFPLLPGLPVPADAHRTPALWAAMARAMAAIHGATPAVADLPLAEERYEVPELAGAERGLREPARGLDRVIGPRRAELAGYVERFRRVREAVARLPGRRVLCHRDFGGDNLLVDSAGRLSVLDWDWCALAPPEHDLWFAAGAGLAPFLAAYREAGGIPDLQPEQLRYALLRRGLSDLGARVVRLLDEDVEEAEAAELLDGIVRWGFDRCALAVDDAAWWRVSG